MRAIPAKAVDFVAKHEGKRLKAYPDPATGGKPYTIGYGHTGPDVVLGMTITDAEAKALLRKDLGIAAGRIQERIGGIVNELTENQYSALLSFVFNVGANPSWTIWKRLKARQFDQVPQELMKFVNAGGKKMQGLVNRRAEEVKLWSTDEPGSVDYSAPSSVTRSIVTPPTPSDPVHPAKSATLLSGAVSAVGVVSVAATQVTETIAPWALHSPIVGQVVTVVAAIAAAAAVITLALNWIAKRKARN